MMCVRSARLHFGALLVAAVELSMPATAFAYSQEQQQACTPDAFRLCGSDIPDVDRVTVCMIRNKSQLSPGCRAHFRPEREMAPATARAPMSLKPAIAGARVSGKPVRARPVSAKTRKPGKPTKPAGT
jgi:hypothetical protein